MLITYHLYLFSAAVLSLLRQGSDYMSKNHKHQPLFQFVHYLPLFVFQISLLVLSILFILLVEEHVPLLLALSVNHCAIPFCSSLFENEILTPGKSVAKYINFSKCRISSHQFSILWSRGLTHSALVLGIQSGTSVFCYLLPDFMKSYLEVGSNLIV